MIRSQITQTYTDLIMQSLRIFTSNCISRHFLSGHAKGVIEKMRSIFFQRVKSIPITIGTAVEAKLTLYLLLLQCKKQLLPLKKAYTDKLSGTTMPP
jgi:hypothetical protein